MFPVDTPIFDLHSSMVKAVAPKRAWRDASGKLRVGTCNGLFASSTQPQFAACRVQASAHYHTSEQLAAGFFSGLGAVRILLPNECVDVLHANGCLIFCLAWLPTGCTLTADVGVLKPQAVVQSQPGWQATGSCY